jgi:hypothetical protein
VEFDQLTVLERLALPVAVHGLEGLHMLETLRVKLLRHRRGAQPTVAGLVGRRSARPKQRCSERHANTCLVFHAVLPEQ